MLSFQTRVPSYCKAWVWGLCVPFLYLPDLLSTGCLWECSGWPVGKFVRAPGTFIIFCLLSETDRLPSWFIARSLQTLLDTVGRCPLESLEQRISTFPMLRPFNAAPHAVVTPGIKLILLLSHNCDLQILVVLWTAMQISVSSHSLKQLCGRVIRPPGWEIMFYWK